MRAKILSSTSTFNGVSYNTNKTQNEKGELMRYRNFGYLQDNDQVGPEEMKNFLKAHSKRNSLVKNKQFHAMISCKGREYSKEQLTDIAHEWLDKMGYSGNPFLIVFHKDTANNHVHIVSSRIDKLGKKIDDSFEKVRAQRAINEIMRLDPKQEVSKALKLLDGFSYETKNQAFLILENLGYTLQEKEQQIQLIKYGSVQHLMPLTVVLDKAKTYEFDKPRSNQLKAILDKYSRIYNSNPIPVYKPSTNPKEKKQLGYRSDLGDFVKDKFGLQLIFHGKEGKNPYGYTIIDTSHQVVFKGSEVFPLKRFLDGGEGKKYDQGKSPHSAKYPDRLSGKVQLQSVLNDFSTVQQGLAHYSLKLEEKGGVLFLKTDQGNISIKDLLPADQVAAFGELNTVGEGQVHSESNANSFVLADLVPSLNMSQDVDDQAVNGNERRKKWKSDRRNTK